MRSSHVTISPYFKVAFSILFMLLAFFTTQAQDLVIKPAGVIGNELVNDIAADKAGNACVLTFNQIYRISKTGKDSLIQDTISAETKFRRIYIDNNDQIWLATYNSLLLSLDKELKVRKVQIVPQLCSVNYVARDYFDNLWLALSNNQIKVYGYASRSILTKTFTFPSAPRSLYIDVDNTKWIGTESGLYFIAKTEKPKRINRLGTINSIKEYQGSLYFTALKDAEHHFYKYDKKKKKLNEIVLPQELARAEIRSFDIDVQRNKIVFASNFLAVLDLHSGLVKSYHLPSNALRCVMVDKDGTYWIGTEGKGLYVGRWSK